MLLSTIDLAEIESACQQVLKLAIVGDTFWVDAILYEIVKIELRRDRDMVVVRKIRERLTTRVVESEKNSSR